MGTTGSAGFDGGNSVTVMRDQLSESEPTMFGKPTSSLGTSSASLAAATYGNQFGTV
jgi:hypothetical protein